MGQMDTKTRRDLQKSKDKAGQKGLLKIKPKRIHIKKTPNPNHTISPINHHSNMFLPKN